MVFREVSLTANSWMRFESLCSSFQRHIALKPLTGEFYQLIHIDLFGISNFADCSIESWRHLIWALQIKKKYCNFKYLLKRVLNLLFGSFEQPESLKTSSVPAELSRSPDETSSGSFSFSKKEYCTPKNLGKFLWGRMFGSKMYRLFFSGFTSTIR